MNKNLKILPFFEIFRRFAPHFLIAPLYYRTILGSYTLSMLVFAISLTSSTLSEVPMGIISDSIGRRKTLIFASFFKFIGFVLMILAGSFHDLRILFCFSGAILFGMTQALYSSTVDAFIFESVRQNSGLEKYNEFYSRIKGCGAASAAISAILAGIISYHYQYSACFILSAFTTLGTFICAFYCRDIMTASPKVSFSSIKQHLSTVYHTFAANQKLFLISLAKIFGDNVSYRIDVIYFKMLIPEYLLGTPRMCKKFFECFSYLYAPYLIKRFKPLGVLVASNTWIMAVRGLAITVNNFLSPYIDAMVDLLDGTSTTAFSNLLQHQYTDKQRATMNSVVSMASSIWTSFLLLVIGAIIDYTSVRTALLILILYRLIRLAIYFKISRISSN